MSAIATNHAIDLDAVAESAIDQIERRAELDARDREYGGMRSIDDAMAEQALAAERQKWLAYKPEITKRELAALRHGEPANDARRITAGRLREDCRAAVARWSKLHAPDDRELLTDDALYILMTWPVHGSAPSEKYPRAEMIDLGGKHALALARIRADRIKRERRSAGDPRADALAALSYVSELERLRDYGSLPLRRDWLDVSRRDRNGYPMLTRGALRALKAAVKQALSTRYWRAERDRYRERQSGEMIDLDAAMDARAAELGERENLPPSDAPEVIADVLELPLDAGRAIIAQHEIRAHASGALRAQWNMSESVYKSVVSRGARIVREQYSAETLLDALRDAPRRYRAMCERAAIVALIDCRDGYIEPERAAIAVEEYRAVSGSMPELRRIHLAAARAAMQREATRAYGGRKAVDPIERMRARSMYGAEISERIAMSAERIIRAELRREYHGRLATSAVASTYPGAIIGKDGAVSAPRIVWHKLSEPERLRRADVSAELASLLDSGSPHIERIAELRCELYPGWSHIEPEPDAIIRGKRQRIELLAWKDICKQAPAHRANMLAELDELYGLRLDYLERAPERRSAPAPDPRRAALLAHALKPCRATIAPSEPQPRAADSWAFIRRSHPRNLRPRA